MTLKYVEIFPAGYHGTKGEECDYCEHPKLYADYEVCQNDTGGVDAYPWEGYKSVCRRHLADAVEVVFNK